MSFVVDNDNAVTNAMAAAETANREAQRACELHLSFMSENGFSVLGATSFEDLAVKLQKSTCDEDAWLRVLDKSGQTRGWMRRDGVYSVIG